jgi:hypothetical protein
MQNIGIILTSTVNVNLSKTHLFQVNPTDRISTYLKSVKQWLEKTPLRICLVENSGYTFPELNEEKEKYKDRFDIISYVENQVKGAEHVVNNVSKGSSEILSINIARTNSKVIKDCLFFIKITARFFIPEFYNYLLENSFDEKVVYDGFSKSIMGIRQNNADRCELLGCSNRLFPFIFNMCLIDDLHRIHNHIEAVYKHRFECISHDTMWICKEFTIEPTQRGGNYEVYSTI